MHTHAQGISPSLSLAVTVTINKTAKKAVRNNNWKYFRYNGKSVYIPYHTIYTHTDMAFQFSHICVWLFHYDISAATSADRTQITPLFVYTFKHRTHTNISFIFIQHIDLLVDSFFARFGHFRSGF